MITQIACGEITVEVVRMPIKHLHLSVYPPHGRVRIAAPSRMSLDTIRVFTITKLGWITPQKAGQGGCRLEATGELPVEPHRLNSRWQRSWRLTFPHIANMFMSMKLTLQLQLLPNDTQAHALRGIVARFNEAATWLAGVAFAQQCANKVVLQKLAYYELRERFGLPADAAIRCIAQVVEAYKRDKTIAPTFRPHAAVPFSMRKNLGFKGPDRVSIQTLTGRVVVPYLMGAYQAQRFGFAHGQADLVLRRDGQWFLLVTVDVPEGTPVPSTDFIGVDLGVVNLATSSDGTTHSGAGVDACRTKYARRRQRLQRAAHVAQMDGKRPKNIRRALKRTARREAGFRRDVNHCISKRLVAVSTGTARGIALEDLQNIRARTQFRKPQRARMSGWAFAQLRSFVEYKAQLAGVPVVLVNPRHTSQQCSVCGHIAKANRRSQAVFSCQACGRTTHADFNAALNIRSRARVSAPMVAVRLSEQLLLGLAKPATSCLL